MTDGDSKAVLGRRPVIGIAQGVLMEQFNITADEAFQDLWQMSHADPVETLEVARTLANSTG
jgi:AmiR/NasT family two-component response regulator